MSIFALITPHMHYILTGEDQLDDDLDFGRDSSKSGYDYLKDIDPVSANRIHPNNHRKVRVPTLFLFFSP